MYGSTIFYSPPSPATDFRDNRTYEYPRPKPPYTHTISPYETSKFRYRTLSLKMGSVPFTINSETLTRMFSKFGMIESIQFKRQWPSLDATIRFQIVENAIAAKSAMEHRYLYEVGGMMEINYAADEFEYSGRGILSPKSSPSIETYGQSSQLLRVSIGFAWYPITAELVSGVFSYYGNVQILQMRQVGDAVEATLHYQSLQSAIVAQHALQGRNIHYTGGKMDIQFALESQPTMEQNFERIEEALKKLENICNSLTSIPDRVGCDESNASATSADSITDNPTQVQGISIVEPIVDNVSFIPCIKVLNSDISNLNCETENIVCDIASFTSFNELEKTDFVEIQGDKVNVHEVFDELTMRIDEDHFVANDDEHLTDPKCYNDDTPHLNSEVRISDGFVNFDGQLVQKASPKMLKFEDVEGQLSFDSQLSYDYRHMFLLPRSMDNISISQLLLTEVAKSSNHYTYSSSSHALENVLRSKTMEWDPGIKKWEKNEE